jgi:hypothetical protein
MSWRVAGGSGFFSVGDLDPDPNMHGSAAIWSAVSGSTSDVMYF